MLFRNLGTHNFYLNFYKVLQKDLNNFFIQNKKEIKDIKIKFPFYTIEDIKFRLVRDRLLTLNDYGIAGKRLDGFTGVWIDADKDSPRKICAIGVKCSRWVTMHGIGFNINSNLDYFKYIVPCGIEDKSVTSLQKETNQEIDMEELKLRFKKNFKILFGINLIEKK